MKLGVFTDAHYCRAECLCKTRRPSLSLRKIKEAMEHFRDGDVDLCICLGDLTDHAPGDTKEAVVQCFHEALNCIESYGLPFCFVPGNHDYLMMTAAELESALPHRLPPYAVTVGEYELVLLDGNYRTDGRRFDEAGVEWTDSNLPTEQLRFLSETLAAADRKCVILIHENLDPFVEPRHIVGNAEEIRKILRDSGKAKTVLQGHYHPGAEHTVDGISYITLPAMCEGTRNAYRIFEFGSVTENG